MRRLLLGVTVLVLVILALPALAGGNHDDCRYKPWKCDTTTTPTTVPETTPTTEATTTTTEATTTTTEATTTTTTPESFCIDPNHATVNQLLLVQGVTEQIAVAIVATTSFDGPFGSVAEVQAAYGLGNQVLEPVFPDWPGFFSDECLTSSETSQTTTTTTLLTSTTLPSTPTTALTELPFTGPADSVPLIISALLFVGLGVGVLRSRKRDES